MDSVNMSVLVPLSLHLSLLIPTSPLCQSDSAR